MNKALLIAASVLIASGCSNSNINPEDVTSGSTTAGAADGGGGQPQFDDVPGGQPDELPPTTEDTDNILITPEEEGTAELTPARLLDVLNGNMVSPLDSFASLITTSGNAADNPIAGATFTGTDAAQTPVIKNFDCDAGGKLSYDETDPDSARTYTLENCVLDGQTFNGTLTHTPGSEHRFNNFSVMQDDNVVIQVQGAYGETTTATGDAMEHSWNFIFYNNPGLDLLLRNSSVRETLSSSDGCSVFSSNCAASRKLTLVIDLVASWSNNKPLLGSGTWTSMDKGDYTMGILEATTADGSNKISLDADNGDPGNFSSVVEVNGVATSEVINWSDTGVTCRTSGAENIQLDLCQ